jgi:hypothetical protein
MRLAGSVFHPDGSIHQVEIKGPPSFEAWQACYTGFRRAATLLDLADLGTLLSYEKQIFRYHSRYGAASWLILYQADVRTRAEFLPRLRLRLDAAHTIAVNAGNITPYDVHRPWNYTVRAAIEETKWWHVEVEEPSLLLTSRSQSMAHLATGDASAACRSPGAVPFPLPRWLVPSRMMLYRLLARQAQEGED